MKNFNCFFKKKKLSIRVSGKNRIFNDKKIKKSNFFRNIKLLKIDYIDVNKILVSKREPYGKKKLISVLY